MSKTSQNYILTQEERDKLLEKLGTLEKQNVSLQQELRLQQTQSVASSEDLFLELLEVGDALEALLEYLENNDLTPEFLQRLPRSVGAVHRKFLNILKKRQVFPIELEGTQPDFNLCRVVDREIRTDLEDQTITKIVLGGFRCGEKILRPAEVITSLTE
ncbi:nucleotide exchange factor GrpE [Tolypothrix sp. VBCCA 56010]|uniref:nucleotide exchange factor GrpE n=1 Tax=Tolypothrix sp. VBCCA 56010 TaxID=3137731 RepID=UPI003D7E8851